MNRWAPRCSPAPPLPQPGAPCATHPQTRGGRPHGCACRGRSGSGRPLGAPARVAGPRPWAPCAPARLSPAPSPASAEGRGMRGHWVRQGPGLPARQAPEVGGWWAGAPSAGTSLPAAPAMEVPALTPPGKLCWKRSPQGHGQDQPTLRRQPLGGRVLKRRSHLALEGAAWTTGAEGLPGGWG